MKQKTGQEWIDDLEKAGVPCGPLNNMAQVFDHPQVRARGMQIELDHPLADTVPQVASPIKIVGEELVYQGSPPTLGQHSNDILKNLLGMSPEKITDLEEKKIINS